MYKRNSNIVFGIIVFFSLVQLLITLNIVPFPEFVLQSSVYLYILFVIAGAYLMLYFTGKIISEKPKEKIKIVYKNIKEEKVETKNEEKKTKEKIQKYASLVMTDLNEIDNHEKFSEVLLRNFSKTFKIVQGVVYIKEGDLFKTSNTYAFYKTETAESFQIGEGLPGQVAKNKEFLFIDNVPKDYITVLSGLGDGSPKYLAFVPIVRENETIAVIEFTMFEKLPTPTKDIFKLIAKKISPYFEKFL